MKLFSYLVLLTYTSMPHARIVSAVSGEESNGYGTSTLNATRSANTNLTVTDHSPYINFIDTARTGLEEARRISRDARPAVINAHWGNNRARVPNLDIFFIAPTKNFLLLMEDMAYGRWSGPYDWTAEELKVPGGAFLWITLDGVDLPEAWQAVRERGWAAPLWSFAVYKDVHNYGGELIYRFADQEIAGRYADFGVRSKRVLIHGGSSIDIASESLVSTRFVHKDRQRESGVATS